MSQSTPDNAAVRIDWKLAGVLFAGVVISGLCAYRMLHNRPVDAASATAIVALPAPAFEAMDESNEFFRLKAYLGRHRIIVVFYDGDTGADQNADLRELQRRADELKRLDVKLVGVSRSIPQFNRAAIDRMGEFPGPLVSDIEGAIQDVWGRSLPNGGTRPGLFLVDRKGFVRTSGGVPLSYESVDDLWKDLSK